jgi:hypothetical protein
MHSRWMQLRWLMCAGALGASALGVQAADKTATVAIDPATGKLRPVEHDDKLGAAQNSTAKRPVFGAAAKPQSPLMQSMMSQPSSQVQQHANGARSAMVNPKRYSYSVAKRQADGSITTQCAPGEDAAVHALHAQTAKAGVKQGGAHVE